MPSHVDVPADKRDTVVIPTCPGATEFPISDLWLHGGICSIDLGDMPGVTNGLQVTLPVDYDGAVSADEMFETLLPEWHGSLTLSASEAAACIRYQSSSAQGLLWQGTYGFYKTALNYAIRTLHAFADDVSDPTGRCSMRSDILRGYIEDASVPIITNPTDAWACDERVEANFDISDSGRVTVKYDHGEVSGPNGWAFWGEVRICERNRPKAALADYYFWWATRLLHYSVYRGGGFLAAQVAVACARAGLAEIVDLAGILLHEYGHISGSAYHCSDVWGRYSCCQYLMQYLWIEQSTARLGLPRSQLADRMIWDGDYPRLVDGTRPWHYRRRVPRGLRCDSGGKADPTKVEASHCDLLDLEHRVDLKWTVTADCADAGSSGSISRFTTYAFCGGTTTGGHDRRKDEVVDDDKESGLPRRDRLD